MDTRDMKPSSSGLDFQLHPCLVLINVSDHYTRTKANSGDQAEVRVLGCLLGQQEGRVVDISNSFEIKYELTPEGYSFDDAFLTKKQDQYKQTFPNLDVVGWYATGGRLAGEDMVLHRKIMNINESPVYLLLDPVVHPLHKDLPVGLFESELQVVDGSSQHIFTQAKYSIKTSEAERIGVNQVAKVLPSGSDSSTEQLTAHYATLQSAIKMLDSRVAALLAILQDMASGKRPPNQALLRQASNLMRSLPSIDSPTFSHEYLMDYNDAMLTVYLSTLTKGTYRLNELVDKINVAFDSSSKRRGVG